jgi:hypothetical protein
MACAIISHTDENDAMNTTAQAPSAESIHLVAAVSTLLAGFYFVAVNFLF